MKKKNRFIAVITCLLMTAGVVTVYGESTRESDPVDDTVIILEDGELDADSVDAVLDEALLDELVSDNETALSENLEVAEAELEPSPYLENFQPVAAVAEVKHYILAQAITAGDFINIQVYNSFDEAKSAMNSKAESAANTATANSYVVRDDKGRVVAMVNGMAVAASAESTLAFSNTHGGRKPYVSNNTTMYYEETVSLDEVRVTINGVVGETSYANLILIPAPFMYGYADSSFNKYERDYYSVNSSGELVHTITTFSDKDTATHYESGEKTTSASITIDKAPSFMKTGTRYYSNDGVNYYTGQFLTEFAGTYYPYYQYLSYHTETSYTAEQLNSYISYYTTSNNKSNSVLKGTGAAFIQAQEDAGINALLELAFAMHESGGGTSSISLSKNNVFGINAFDGSASTSATTYSTVQECIADHAGIIMKERWLDALDDFRYFGASAGNKAVGVNVVYASDPYHGEKVASWAYRIDKYLNFGDYDNYQIGISGYDTPVYKTATGSAVLYNLSNQNNKAKLSGLPVVILQESGTRYQVQSDMGIDASGNAHYEAPYSYRHVGYAEQSEITVRESYNAAGTGTLTSPESPSDEESNSSESSNSAGEDDISSGGIAGGSDKDNSAVESGTDESDDNVETDPSEEPGEKPGENEESENSETSDPADGEDENESEDNSITDSDTGITVTGAIPEGADLEVVPVTSGEFYDEVTALLGEDADDFVLYDLCLIKDDAVVQPEGKVVVSIPFSQKFDNSRISVFHISEDSELTDMNAIVKRYTAQFETDHFSYYALAQMAPIEQVVEQGPLTVVKSPPSTSTQETVKKDSLKVAQSPSTNDSNWHMLLMLSTLAVLALGSVIACRKTSHK